MIRFLTALLAVVALLLPSAAHSDQGPALTVSPNPTAAYYAGSETFAGCNYTPGDWIDAYVTVPGAAFGAVVGSGPVDAAGCIDIVTAGWVGEAGEYLVATAVQVQTGQTVKVRVLAETTVTVTG